MYAEEVEKMIVFTDDAAAMTGSDSEDVNANEFMISIGSHGHRKKGTFLKLLKEFMGDEHRFVEVGIAK